jgi:hypothetical protein
LAASLTGLVLILVALVAIDVTTPWPGYWAGIPVLGTVLIIGAGSNSVPNRVVLSNRTLVRIGLISYPLYLWHWPALVYGRILNQEQVPRAGRIALLLVSFVLAIATYWFIERPIRFGAHKKRSAKWLLGGVGAMAASGLMVQFHLLPSRLDDLYSTSVERAATDEAPGGTFNRLGTDIVAFELPGDTRRTVAFVGDSHMTQYWPRFVKLSHDTSRNNPRIIFLTYGGCPPLPEVNAHGLSWDGSPWRCPFFHERAMARLADPRVKSVVFGAYWETYLEKGSMFATRHSNAQLTPLAAVTDSVFSEFEEEVGALVKEGKHVFIVLSNPSSPAYNPHSMLPARLPWLMNKSMRTSISKGEFLKRSNATMNRLRDIAKRTGASVIDPVNFLCGNDGCPTVSADGEPIYRDDHHLRATYARDHASFMDIVVR